MDKRKAMRSGKLHVIPEKKPDAQDRIKMSSLTNGSNKSSSDHWQDLAKGDSQANISSSWEQGISTINSVLEPGSASRAALSADQIAGLESLRKVLAGGTPQDEDMVPKTILETAQSGNNVSAFLAMEFGGVKEMSQSKKGKGLAALRRSVRKITYANRFVGGLNEAMLEHKMLQRPSKYVPPEYEALSPSAKEKVRSMLSLENLVRWDYNIFDLAEVCNGQPLLFMGWAILCSPYAQSAMDHHTGVEKLDGKKSRGDGYDFVGSFSASPSTICEFLRFIESEYVSSNPYHNSTHAADVLQTTHTLLQLGAKKFSSDLLQEYSLLIAAAVHDIGHPGKNNNYQVNARTEVAIRYNDTAVLENMHVSKMFSKIVGPDREQNINVFGELTDDQFSSARTSIIRTVIDTDMARHFRNMSKLKGFLSELDGSIDPEHWQAHDNGVPATKLLQFVLHVADISNPAKPAPIFEQWTTRVLDEFFAQGDVERKENLPISPLCDRRNTSRAESQIGFIKYIVKPAFELLEQIVPGSAGEILGQIDSNLEYWEKQKLEEGGHATKP